MPLALQLDELCNMTLSCDYDPLGTSDDRFGYVLYCK